jgi:hypothetical protein
MSRLLSGFRVSFPGVYRVLRSFPCLLFLLVFFLSVLTDISQYYHCIICTANRRNQTFSAIRVYTVAARVLLLP